MARQAAGVADVAGLPRAFTKGHDVDYSWTADAKCVGENHRSEGPFINAWFADPRIPFQMPDGTKIDGAAIQEVALMVCASCPVQWQCAGTAMRIEEDFGTWGLSHDDLEWLIRQPDRVKILARAEARQTPVQFAVTKVRVRRTTIPA